MAKPTKHLYPPYANFASFLNFGRASVLDDLYRRYAGWLGRMLAWRLRSTALDVDDIVQETYVRMARYAPADAERHPKALLLKIAVIPRAIICGAMSCAADWRNRSAKATRAAWARCRPTSTRRWR